MPEEVRQLRAIVDGDHLYRAPKDLMGRAPERGERVDYKRLLDAASWTVFGPRRVSAHYFQRRHMGGDGLYSTLESMGYELHLFPYDQGWEQVKNAILVELAALRQIDCDLLFIGGDNYRGRFEQVLEELQAGPLQRQVGIVHLDGACQFNRARFETFDLIRDLAAMPESIYEAAVETRQYPAGYPSHYAVGDINPTTQLGEQLQEELGGGEVAAPQPTAPPPPRPARLPQTYRHLQSQIPMPAQPPASPPIAAPRPAAAQAPPAAPQPSAQPVPPQAAPQPAPQPAVVAPTAAPPPPPTAAPAAPAGPRNVLVLIDHENIDWSLGNLIGPAQLNAETRPRWKTLRTFVESRANGGAVQFLSFLQHNDVITGFAVYLDGEEGFRPILLESEIDQTGRRRPVVDEAIHRSLAALRERECDVLVVTNDGGYLIHLRALRETSAGIERRFGVIGFVDEMSALYRQEDWIEVFDLERDVGAFTYTLPRRYMPIAIDKFDVDSVLGDFGLGASDAPAESAAAATESADSAEAAPAEAEELVEFEIDIAEVGANEVGVIKAVKDFTDYTLLEAKHFVESSSEELLVVSLSREQAESFKTALETAGATIEISEA